MKQDPSRVPVATLVVSSACTAEVRATKSVLDVWRVIHAEFEYANCSEGNARASMWDRPTGEGYTEREPDNGVKRLRKPIQ